MNATAKILLVEDDSAIVATLKRVLENEGYEVWVEKTGDAGLARAVVYPFDVVLTDLRMPGMGGLELVRKLHVARPRLPILMMTAHGTTSTAIEATQSGAYDYLLKPFEMPELLRLVAQAVAASQLMSEPVQLGTAGPSRDAIIGNSRAMQAIYKEIGRIAAKPVTVLIRGETGTGASGSRSRSSPLIAPPSPRRCWRANCSGTNAALSPARNPVGSAGLNRRIVARSFWTRSAICRPEPRSN
jgi:DNA-binding NtrC family response regulator